MGLRVEEERASECRTVIAWIGGATFLHAKAGRLLSGLSSRENLNNRLKKRRQMMEPQGTGAASDAFSVRRPQARIVKAIQEGCPFWRTASLTGRLKGLSRMMRKCHVRFLGEGVAVRPLPYLTGWLASPILAARQTALLTTATTCGCRR